MLTDGEEIDAWMGKVFGVVESAASRANLPEGWPTSGAATRNYTWLAGNITEALTEEWNNYVINNNISHLSDEEWAK